MNGTDWAARAQVWMEANPKLMEAFTRFTLRAAQLGRPFGMKLVAERVRWEAAVEWGGDYKINNNFVAYIGRRIAEQFPQVAALIRFRAAGRRNCGDLDV